MGLNTITVSAAVTPTVVETCIAHVANRRKLRQKPIKDLSYHQGLQLIRQFLHFASLHTIEELQAFTSQWVPWPRWVKVDVVEIPSDKLSASAELLQKQLGPSGIQKVGGKTWWQWRPDGSQLAAEWIEMRKDYNIRRKSGDNGRRFMLYVHGGGYYFGSVDEHRYQMQRHARKLNARVLAPRYRLAPQFPFPCGLQDCLATYLYLLEVTDPSTIILAGDSAGAGMLLSVMVILRDQGIPLPAGAVLISPWVDLTHSFPSLTGDASFDYIPPHGFFHKPSMSWPPPASDDTRNVDQMKVRSHLQNEGTSTVCVTSGSQHNVSSGAEKGIMDDKSKSTLSPVKVIKDNAEEACEPEEQHTTNEPQREGADRKASQGFPTLSVILDGQRLEIKDQIQIYAPNHMLSHPLVSPVLQPTLGGLPPLLIQVGGGELLRDEQIYLAHKAANPKAHLPSKSFLDEYDPDKQQLEKHRPTDVQLQVWQDLCHVATTLSFTKPAKFMYRSAAQFGAWALARAQEVPIDILEDDDVSSISGSSSPVDGPEEKPATANQKSSQSDKHLSPPAAPTEAVGKAGDPLPPFENHMIRQHIDPQGRVRPLAPASELPALQLRPEEIGVVKEGPVRKWLEMQERWNARFERERLAVQKQRIKEMQEYEVYAEEVPPPSALAGRRKADMPKPIARTKSIGLSLWSGWASKHDRTAIDREIRADMTEERPRRTSFHKRAVSKEQSGSRSRRRSVTDQGQTKGK